MPIPRPPIDSPKTCSGCDEEYPRTSEFFHLCRSKWDGLQTKCKRCQSKYTVAWQRAHPEEAAATQLAYRLRDPERYREKYRRWASAHPEAVVAFARRWQTENPDKARVIKRRANRNRDARERGAFVESVRDEVLWERDRGFCGICGLPADPDNWQVDHVIPIVREGEHSYANTQVSHPHCNAWKADRLTSELPAVPPAHILKHAHSVAA